MYRHSWTLYSIGWAVHLCTGFIDAATFFFAGPPFPPQNPSYAVQQYGQSDVTLSVQWQSPVYDGGAPVDNYTITVTPGGSSDTIPGTSTLLTLSYNVMHTVNIVATNCNGSSNVVMETIRIGKLV